MMWLLSDVDRVCGEAVLRGADVFCRGVLAASAGITEDMAVTLVVDLDKVR
jgi:methyltransferase NSUN6